MSWRNSEVADAAIARFTEKASALLGIPVSVFENPSEELVQGAVRGKAVRLFQRMGRKKRKGPPVRLEENYLYSTRRFAAGAIAASQFPFFNYAVNADPASGGFPAGTGNLSELETNLDTAQQVPYGKNFSFRQMGVSLNSDIVTGDLAQLMDAGWLRFTKGGDNFLLRHGPMRFWPGGHGIQGYSTANNTTAAHNGLGDPRAVRNLKVPRVILAQEVFSYAYVVPRAFRPNTALTAWNLANDCFMMLWLWGGQADDISA